MIMFIIRTSVIIMAVVVAINAEVHHLEEPKPCISKDHVKYLKNELTQSIWWSIRGHKNLAVALTIPLQQYYAKEIRREPSIVYGELVMTVNNKMLLKIKDSFQYLNRMSLETFITAQMSKNPIYVALLSATRAECDDVEEHILNEDAMALAAAEPGTLKARDSVFYEVMKHRSIPHLRKLFQTYDKMTNKTFVRVIRSEFKNDAPYVMTNIVKFILDAPKLFAERLHGSMYGIGTDEATLERIMVTRCGVDMPQIRDSFYKRFHYTLGSSIAGDTSWDYKEWLLRLL